MLLLDGDLDTPVVSMLEQKFEKSHFTRVDADILSRLIQKEDEQKVELADNVRKNLEETFRSQAPKMEKAHFNVEVQNLGAEASPVVMTQSEYMRRMKDISRFQSGMGFYAQMPDTYTMVLNNDHALIQRVIADMEEKTSEALKPIEAELRGQEARKAVLQQEQDKKKPEEVTQEEKDDMAATEKAIHEQQDKRNEVIAEYAKDNAVVHQLIDLALLQNGMLKGAALDAFLKRSVELI